MKLAFAREQTFAQQYFGALEKAALDELALLRDQYFADQIGMVEQVNVQPSRSEIGQVAVLAGDPHEELDRFGAKRDEIANHGQISRAPRFRRSGCEHTSYLQA